MVLLNELPLLVWSRVIDEENIGPVWEFLARRELRTTFGGMYTPVKTYIKVLFHSSPGGIASRVYSIQNVVTF